MIAASAGRRAAAEFAALFPVGAVSPIELGGMTAVLRAICPGEITARMTMTRRLPLSAGELEIDDGQRETLQAGPDEPACRRTGHLADAVTGELAAATDVVILLRRVPWDCRVPLGFTRAGSPAPGRPTVPLGAALSHRNVYRTQVATLLTPGAADQDGALAVYSEAVLAGTRPIALVTERVYGGFLDRYPPPWASLPSALRDAA